jgi:hypothetical protein
MRKLFYILILFLFPVYVMAQDETGVDEEMIIYNYPTTIPDKLSPMIEGDFKLPTPFYNKAFRKIANGIGDMNLHFQMPLFKGFMLGGGFKFGYYQFIDFINSNSFSNSGKLFIYSPYGKLSYIKFTTPRLFFQFSVKAGYSIMQFNSYTCTNSGEGTKGQNNIFIEPQLSANIFVDESLSFSVLMSNTTMFNNFNPSLLCLESFNGFSPEDSQGNYHIFGIGFGFTYFFNRKQS